ncbi:hypothetical protein DC083_01085 [Ignatzschineria ureiclastica]|uniref:Uncharacterized protein n=2 Tax=Ignatzschineria ureiclastica TaxID=472582 RepID=A0A2U2AGN5_9GAMM|nr:hypothetical protein DC083_01085 [Ignatzschineria ureiclastica]GGZ90731.1 hypothetical protein GCM10007162_02100 [Ignatzschineria ureiclastica]
MRMAIYNMTVKAGQSTSSKKARQENNRENAQSVLGTHWQILANKPYKIAKSIAYFQAQSLAY